MDNLLIQQLLAFLPLLIGALLMLNPFSSRVLFLNSLVACLNLQPSAKIDLRLTRRTQIEAVHEKRGRTLPMYTVMY